MQSGVNCLKNRIKQPHFLCHKRFARSKSKAASSIRDDNQKSLLLSEIHIRIQFRNIIVIPFKCAEMLSLIFDSIYYHTQRRKGRSVQRKSSYFITFDSTGLEMHVKCFSIWKRENQYRCSAIY